MHIVNERRFACPPGEAFTRAARVDRWPALLPHYRWVRFLAGGPEEGGVVEMAARRAFGRLGWPVWWRSRMWVDPRRREVRYRHIAGVTRGMEVRWQIEPDGGGSQVRVLHAWDEGPRLAGPLAPAVGRGIILPLFVHFIADQTLFHLSRQAAGEVAR